MELFVKKNKIILSQKQVNMVCEKKLVKKSN